MLRIEPPVKRTYSEESATRDYGTLDDVPDFALASMAHLHNYLIRPFQKSYGLVLHGPCRPHKNDENEWGRKVHLPSGEFIQLKFSPVCILQDYYQGLAMISLRLSSPIAGSEVKTCILFPPKSDVPVGNYLIKRMRDGTGPRGLHMLMITFFHQHHPEMTDKHHMDDASWTIDPYGYGSVRSTTFSISKQVPMGTAATCKKARRGEFATFNHSTADCVAPGASPFIVAYECVNCEAPDNDRRPCEPMNPKKYDQLVDDFVNGMCAEDAEIGRSAIQASVSICQLLSGEGLLSMMSHPFLENALPIRIKSPLGMGMIISMCLRIAMCPDQHGMYAHQYHDQIASAELKTMFESQINSLTVCTHSWALDVVIRMGKRECMKMNSQKFDQDQQKSQQGTNGTNGTNSSPTQQSKKATLEMKYNDQIHYWFRVGQSIISSVFGPGSSVDFPMPGRFGVAWRFHDPLIAAKDAKTIALGMEYNQIRDQPPIDLVPIHKKRTTLIRLLVETEKYLRTGVFEGERLAKTNDFSSLSDEQKETKRSTLKYLFDDYVKQELQTGVVPEITDEGVMLEKIHDSYCIPATDQAVVHIAEALLAGPVVHFQNKIGCYLVSESQESPCCDCGAPVHVLQGVVLCHYFGECHNCHAKRCLACSTSYDYRNLAKFATERLGEQVAFGRPCRSCGTQPPGITVSKSPRHP